MSSTTQEGNFCSVRMSRNEVNPGSKSVKKGSTLPHLCTIFLFELRACRRNLLYVRIKPVQFLTIDK